jgi:hypothetical protein
MVEGVIKYNISRLIKKVPISDKKLNIMRKKLHKMKLIGVYDNNIGYGNISIRYLSGFIISSSQTGNRYFTSQNDFTFVYKPSFFELKAIGTKVASSESMTHNAIYSLSSSINAVVHIHNKELWNYTITKNYPSISEDIDYGTIDMMNGVEKLYNKYSYKRDNIFVTKGHKEGVFIFGSSIESVMLSIRKLIIKYKSQ